MAQVNLIEYRKKSALGELLPIAGAVAGGYIGYQAGGGAPGALKGAGAGAALGQLGANTLDGDSGPRPQQLSSNSEAAAMSRRMQQQSQDNLADFRKAEAALPYLPEDLRQEYGPAIVRARMMEEQRRGLNA